MTKLKNVPIKIFPDCDRLVFHWSCYYCKTLHRNDTNLVVDVFHAICHNCSKPHSIMLEKYIQQLRDKI